MHLRVSTASLTMHCERCGNALPADRDSFQYCLECGLFVCRRLCWPDSSECPSCLSYPGTVHGRRDRLALVRRARRRLTEVADHAARLGTMPVSVAESRTEVACLSIKMATAVDDGERAVVGLRPRRKRTAANFQLSVSAAHEALGRIVQPNPRLPGTIRIGLDNPRIAAGGYVIPAAAAIMLAVVIVSAYVVWRSAQPATEGVRSGQLAAPPGNVGVTSSPSSGSESPTPATTPAIMASETFDIVRMGTGMRRRVDQVGGSDGSAEARDLSLWRTKQPLRVRPQRLLGTPTSVTVKMLAGPGSVGIIRVPTEQRATHSARVRWHACCDYARTTKDGKSRRLITQRRPAARA